MITDSNGWVIACKACGSSSLRKSGTRNTKTLGKVQKYQCSDCNWRGSGVEYADSNVVEHSIKLAKKAQRYQDINRVERKSFRESARILNLHEDLNNKLIDVLSKHQFRKTKAAKVVKSNDSVGILHFSDLHFNELINMEFNQYDFGIASQRIQKYIEQSLANMEADGAGRAIILFGGDLLNSDRRLDEITAACTNRTQAMVLAVEILQQAIARVAEVYEVDIFWVCGNEGRVNKELGFSDFVASDNYDHAIPMMLRHLFAKHEGVTFHYPKNAMECVFKVNGLYWLILHGHVGGGGAPDKKAAGLRAKYAERGICLSYIVWGHIHEAYISDLFARSGSPAGGNSFSDNALGLGGKASLNYYVVSKLGEISGRTIPLQNVDGYEGYDFDESLISYNIKSAKKAERKNVVLEIVV